jgi:hypothetical protein
MKKIFTLMTAVLIAASVFAADHRPQVTINSSKNYKIVVDGRTYFGSDLGITLGNLYGGYHNIQVFEMGRGFYRRERMVASNSFCLDRNDVLISIDFWGNLSIREMRSRRFGNDRDDRDRRDDRGYDNNGRDQRDNGRGQQNDNNGRDQRDNGRGQQNDNNGRDQRDNGRGQQNDNTPPRRF